MVYKSCCHYGCHAYVWFSSYLQKQFEAHGNAFPPFVANFQRPKIIKIYTFYIQSIIKK
jgi:hypothetical protein